MKAIFITFLIILLTGCATGNDCSFEKRIDQFKIDSANSDAINHFNQNKTIKFYAIADGYAPSRPGFDSEERLCVFEKYEWKILWVGGDVIGSCKDREKSQEHAAKYAKAFNKTLKQQLINKGNYTCVTKS